MSGNGTTTLAKAQPTIGERMQLADMFFRSGYFKDAKSAAAALVKIQAGSELGFGPMASMTGVHIIDSKPTIGAHLMAAMIRSSGRYDYRVVESTKDRCEIEFLRLVGKKWEPQPPNIVCTLKEFVDNGTAIGDGGKVKVNWHRSPDDMLFARCISKGYRRHCPDLSCGVSVYVEGEIAGDEQPPQPEHVVDAGPNAGEVVSAPPTANGTPATASPEANALHDAQALADEATINAVVALCQKAGMTEAAAFARAKELYKLNSWSNLTKAQAAEMTAKLNAFIADQQKAAGKTTIHA